MKNCILFLLLLAINISCQNETRINESKSLFSDSETKNTNNNKSINTNYKYPKNILPNKNEEEYGYEFYPIGFSPFGQFAYIDRPCNGGCGCCTHDLIIQDLITDNILNSYRIYSKATDEVLHNKDWNFDYSSIKKILLTNKISQSPLVLERENIFYDQEGLHEFEVIVNKNERYNPDFDNPTINYTVYVKMDGRKSKRITYGKIENGIDLEYLGFIRSPFSNQLALILNKKSYGYEAEYTNAIIPIGCFVDPKYF